VSPAARFLSTAGAFGATIEAPQESRHVTFDPVSDPDAYRRSLLTALGDQDPAAVVAAGADAVRVLAARVAEPGRSNATPRSRRDT
jgi:hypothetical protein